MRPTCPRLFGVEAARDGRLAGAELASFERHVGTCAACSGEAQALDALAVALRAAPATRGDELTARRERTRLLAAFDQALVGPEPRTAPRRWLLAAGVASLVALLFVLGQVRARRASPVAFAVRAVVRADGVAEWSERAEANVDRIVLSRGSLWVHVDHRSAPGLRVVVELPDGELEDTGTTFTVSAAGGRTTRVAVEQGSVVLRVRGRPAAAIGAGEAWSPDTQGAASATASPEPSPSGAAPSPSSTVAAAPELDGPAGAPGPLVRARVPDPGSDFRAAMAALDAGDNEAAAVAFAAFVVKHPKDPRAEDAAYLRVIALQRSGDEARTADAAKDYMRRYPAGFRHGEVEPLAR